MSFLLDKKQEHESACEAKVRAGDYKNAIFHAAKAAEFAYALARQTDGTIQARYLEDAEGWLDIGERLKAQKAELRSQRTEVGGQRSEGGDGSEEPADDEAAKGEWQAAEKPIVFGIDSTTAKWRVRPASSKTIFPRWTILKSSSPKKPPPRLAGALLKELAAR